MKRNFRALFSTRTDFKSKRKEDRPMDFLSSLLRSARVQRFCARMSIVLLVALLLAGCSSAASPTLSNATPARIPPPATTGGPTPVTTPLAAPPTNCAIKSPPATRHLASLGMNSNVDLIGGGPFWFYGMFYSNSFSIPLSDQPQWSMLKIVVEVGPDYAQPVTLHLRNLQTGELVWWTDAQTPPGASTQTLVLDPTKNTESVGSVPGVPDVPHGEVSPGWKEWGIFPVFSVAGCYQFEVSWSGGSWQSVVSVGAEKR
jgi:hypothetical protein